MEVVEKGFLRHVAEEFVQSGIPPKDTLILFPSLRSVAYFRKELAQVLNSPALLPNCLTISQWLAQYSNMPIADSFHRELMLFKTFSGKSNLDPDFVSYAVPKLISDFNELEMYEQDANKAFAYASDLYEIERWGAKTDEKAFHQQYIDLCKLAPQLKPEFEKGILDQGLQMPYQRLDSILNSEIDSRMPQNIWIVGFAVLTQKEMKVFERLEETSNLRYFWKTHQWYCEDENNEAGRFYRNLSPKYSEGHHWMAFNDPMIEYAAFSSNISAARFVIDRLLKDMRTDPSDHSYAIVLGDEKVLPELLPILNLNPELFNVSASLSADYSPLIKELVSVVSNALRKDKSAEEIYATAQKFIKSWDTKQALDLIRSVIQRQQQMILHQIEALQQDQELLRFVFSDMGRFRSWLSEYALSVKGDTDRKVQVFGLLESRNLDVDRLYFLNLNEKNFQGKLRFDSLLPFSLRAQLGLPLNEEKESVFSYYFYSLISSSSAVLLTYLEQKSGFSSSEKSRLIQQVIYEGRFSEVKEIKQDTVLKAETPDVILKDKHFDGELKQFLERGVSASAINLFIRDPFEFYYRYLWRLEEKRKEEPTEDSARIGIIIHECLKMLYKPYEAEELNASNFDRIEKNWKENSAELILVADRESLHSEDLPAYLLTHVFNVILDFINFDRKRLATTQTILVSVEKKYSTELSFRGQKIILKGSIDRLEQESNTLRIIDYKTGRVEARNLKLSNEDQLSQLWQREDLDKIRQLLFYKLLLDLTVKIPENNVPSLQIIGLLQGAPQVFEFENKTSQNLLDYSYIKESVFALIEKLSRDTESFEKKLG